jgi:DNA-binding MarR family transcriptional regulator
LKQPAAGKDARQERPAEAASAALTVTRPALLQGGSDRDFRRLVHNLFGFLARHEAIREGHGAYIGLVGIEYTILISIAHLAAEADVSIRTVADHLHLSGAFVTTVTKRLLAKGLVDKAMDPSDRRRLCLTVTDQGRALLDKLAPTQREVNDVEFGDLSREDFQRLSVMLERLLDSSERALALQRQLAAAASTQRR